MEAFAAIVALAAFATSVLSAVFGMAGGMILMGLYAATLPVQVAMVLHGVTQLFANGFRAFRLRERIFVPGLVWYGLGALASLAFFTWLALVVARPTVFLFMGGIPLALSLLPQRWMPRFERPPAALACGAVCTGASLLSGVSGPLLDVFFVRAELDRFEVIATKAFTQAVGHVLKIVYFAWLVGGPELEMDVPWWLYPVLVACAWLGTVAGGRLLERLTDAHFRRWTGRLVVGLSLVYLWKGVSELGLLPAW
jgi:uncharacterized membrane protein YfcA